MRFRSARTSPVLLPVLACAVLACAENARDPSTEAADTVPVTFSPDEQPLQDDDAGLAERKASMERGEGCLAKAREIPDAEARARVEAACRRPDSVP